MSSRFYGILFSEFKNDPEGSMDDKLVCLEIIRRELEKIPEYINRNFEFDLVVFCSHNKENHYPEIGIYSKYADITDKEFEQIEKFVIKHSNNIVPSTFAKKNSIINFISWQRLKELETYPSRNEIRK